MFLPYGKGQVDLNLPIDAEVLRPNRLPALANPAASLCRALQDPIGSPPLTDYVGQGARVVILVSDSTRPTGSDVFLPILVNELTQAGVADEHITILAATGAHGVMSRQELLALVPAELHHLRILSHDCSASADLVAVGTTSRGNEIYLNRWAVEADLRILTGSISMHSFAGFGGGRKALYPGAGDYDSICRNHALLFADGAKPGVLAGNPVHEDLLEAAQMVRPCFLLNTVMTEDGVAAFFAGDIEQAHVAGIPLVERRSCVYPAQQADTVVASAGGCPHDINLYQAVKALQSAARICRPGGRIVLLAECPQGIGSEDFLQWAARGLAAAQLAAELQQHFQLGKHKAYFLTKILEAASVELYSSLNPSMVESMGMAPIYDLERLAVQGHTVVLPLATATHPIIPADSRPNTTG